MAEALSSVSDGRPSKTLPREEDLRRALVLGLHRERLAPGLVRPGPIEVVDDVDPAVAQVRRPARVVDDVVAEVGDGLGVGPGAAAERRVPFAAAGEEVVVDRDPAGQVAERGEHRVRPLLVQAVVQRLGVDRPLEGEVPAPAEVVDAVDAPRRRDVVEDDVVDVVGVHPVGAGRPRLVLVAEPDAEIADDDVRRLLDLERLVLQADPSPGAVCPAIVRNDRSTFSGVFSSIVPETSKTMVRGPSAVRMPSRSEPGPESSRFVT